MARSNIQPVQLVFALGYNGQRFAGVSPSLGQNTVTHALLMRMARVDHEAAASAYAVSWAARTDRGVGARTNVCSLRLRVPPRDVAQFIADVCLNSCLHKNDGLTHVRCARLEQRVMLRSDAAHKIYQYALCFIHDPCDEPPAINKDGTIFETLVDGASPWRVHAPLFSRGTFAAALRAFEGTHDFYAFTRRLPDNKHFTKRTLTQITCHSEATAQQHRILLTFASPRLLRYQLRFVVGALVQAATGAIDLTQISQSLRHGTAHRAATPFVRAPAQGLQLWHVAFSERLQAKLGPSLHVFNDSCSATSKRLFTWTRMR